MSDSSSSAWAWAPCADADEWSGPFSTRAEAEAHGRKKDEGDYGPGPGVVAPARLIDPVDCLPVFMAEDLLDQMNEADYVADFDEPPFALRDGAEAALLALLTGWVRDHVVLDGYKSLFVVDDTAAAMPVGPA